MSVVMEKQTPYVINNNSMSSNQVMTVSFSKPKTGTRTGICLTRRNRDCAIIISRIKYGSLACGTQLRAGMLLLSINETPINHRRMSCQEVSDLLMNASGTVTITASKKNSLAGAFFKATTKVKTGITIGTTTGGKIVISRIAPYSLAAVETPQLQKGMQIKAINNRSVDGMTRKEAVDLLKSAVGVVTIAVQYESREPLKPSVEQPECNLCDQTPC